MAQAGKRASVLLASATAGGTIAAVRHLDAAGMNVRVLASPGLAPAAWSRSNRHTFSAPSEGDSKRFLERLIAIGEESPGQILLPTSDETAWLYTSHSRHLSEYFLLNQPPVACMRRILDKKLFADAVSKVGLSTIPTWEPESAEHVADIAGTLPYPILIKPRTHVHQVHSDKGLVVQSPNELIRQYAKTVRTENFRSATDETRWEPSTLPLLQRFLDVTEEGVYSVSGYIDRSGELFVTRQSRKVLQRTRPVGIGICFESSPADLRLSESVRRLCLELGYFGIFEVEFLRCDGAWAPIDFNGRLFHQVGLDIRRRMPLPLFACLEAAGDRAALKEEILRAQSCDEQAALYDSFTLRAITTAGSITGRMSFKEREYWKLWVREHRSHAIDVAMDSKDRMPAVVHALSELYKGCLAFPQFLRSRRVVPNSEAVAF